MLPFLPFPPLFPLTFSIVRWLGKRSGVTAKMWAFLMFLTKSSTDDSKLCRLLFPNYQRMQQQKNISSTCADIKYAQNTHWQPTTNRHIIHVMPLTSRGFLLFLDCLPIMINWKLHLPLLSFVVQHRWHFHSSILYDVSNHTTHILSLCSSEKCYIFWQAEGSRISNITLTDPCGPGGPGGPCWPWCPCWPGGPWGNPEQTLILSTHWPNTENTCVILCL